MISGQTGEVCSGLNGKVRLTPIPINTSSLFSLIDFSGVFAGAMGGALEAKQNRTYQFDFVGVLGLGLISALGGGITRDILLQHGPPLAFTDIRYLVIALAGGFIGLLCQSGTKTWQAADRSRCGSSGLFRGRRLNPRPGYWFFVPAGLADGSHYRGWRRFSTRRIQRANSQGV
jgi:hypothetical protein